MADDSSRPKGERGAKYPVHRHVHRGVHLNGQPNLRATRRMRTKRWFALYVAKSPNWAGGPHFLADDPLKSSAGSLPPSQQLRRRVLRGCIHRPENLSDRMSDILHEGERRSPLSILKSPPKQPKAVAIQARVEESVKTQLELYAEFIDASPSYVITEALKLLFRKDDDFRRWADQHANNHNNGKAKGDVLAKAV